MTLKIGKRYKYYKNDIKNKVTNLEFIFYKCDSLKEINELKYLDTKDINNFSYMLSECSSLSDIKPLENWNVSNGKDFSYLKEK